jgi:hypothetical protein
MNELERTYILGKESTTDLKEKAFTEYILQQCVMNTLEACGDSAIAIKWHDMGVFLRNITSQTDSYFRIHLYNHYITDNLTLSYVDSLLESKGIQTIPKNIDDLRNEIEKIKKRIV